MTITVTAQLAHDAAVAAEALSNAGNVGLTDRVTTAALASFDSFIGAAAALGRFSTQYVVDISSAIGAANTSTLEVQQAIQEGRLAAKAQMEIAGYAVSMAEQQSNYTAAYNVRWS